MATPDPLALPSGGTVNFRDSATYFKRAHYRRLAATVETAEDGAVRIATGSENTWRQVDILAEAVIESWHGDGTWYLDGRPVPGDDPAVLEDLSNADTVALTRHLMPHVLDILGFVRGDDSDDEGKGVPPSAASNGSTPTSGSEASTEPTLLEAALADPATSLSDALPIS